MYNLRLKDLRKLNNMTQSDVAKQLNIARETYVRYESGEHQMNYNSLIMLAELFSVSIDYLIGRFDSDSTILNKEEKNLIEQYRGLDDRGKQTVSLLVNHESSICSNKEH